MLVGIASGHRVNFAHNIADRQEVTTDGNGHSTAFDYNSKGAKTRETDALGHVTTFAYDANNAVTRETRTLTVNGAPQTVVTQYVCDANGNFVAEIDRAERRTTHRFFQIESIISE
ncbi:MAG TPA: hypothetical protein PLF22_09945 [Pseudomonadales bacterium]|nr:hypothetical protein [Pseudomonadales bacterium]